MSEPLRIADDVAHADRRASRRIRVTCPATLQTMTTMTEGILGDISETGARFEAAEPPGKGATAVLKWGAHEAVCTIIWHDDGACGVWFKTPLAPELVAETAALDRVLELPIASVGNITQGRKRSMSFLKRAPDGEGEAAPSSADAISESEPCLPVAENGSGFGRAGGLGTPSTGQTQTLAGLFARYRRTGSLER
ncbi:PilZ domain-containing protein [Tsuneonella amylolytica]|uniref:PilZ domain-containing protein n=1 Tax=Tsuneonella amylolytica TaxID=2338327 RepID=UPI0013C52095|nr:PilZ domain-containing protein [Tsuneonella amylolytica]